jgi:hypothetical protein
MSRARLFERLVRTPQRTLGFVPLGLRVPLALIGLYTCAAVLDTWPVLLQLTTHLPHDLGDPVLSLTLLQWNATTIPFTDRWWTGIGYYPLADTLTLSDPRLGISLISTPVFWITGSAVAGYNVAFMLSFVCSALAAHALVVSLTRSHAAGVVAGLSYGFAPYRADHIAHLELLASYWMPIALLALHRWLDTRKRIWLIWLVVGVAAQGLFCAYYLPLFGVLIGFWLLWFVLGKVPVRSLAEVMAAGMLGVVLLAPIFMRFHSAHAALGFRRYPTEIAAFSADLSGLWSPAPELRFVPSFAPGKPEGRIFPGLTIVAVIAAGAWCARKPRQLGRWRRRASQALLAVSAIYAAVALGALHGWRWNLPLVGFRISVASFRKPATVAIVGLMLWAFLHPRLIAAVRSRSVFAFYVLGAVLMVLLALGPNPTLFNVTFLYKSSPYSWLMNLPVFHESLRAPGRFGMLVALTLSIAAGLAWERVRERLGWRSNRAAIVVGALVLAEGWFAPVTTHAVPPQFPWPGRCAGLPRFELPLRDNDHGAAAQYRALLEGTRSVNGATGFIPPHAWALQAALTAGDPESLTALAPDGPICIAVDRSQPGGADVAGWVAEHPLIESIDPTAQLSMYYLRRSASLERRMSGQKLRFASATSTSGPVDIAALSDGDPLSAWMTSGPQRPGDSLTIEFTCRATVASVSLSQGAYAQNFPRALAIEMSGDGVTWRSAWRGRTGGLTVRAALDDPPMVTTTFPIASSAARMLRLRSRGSDADTWWVVAELGVRGRCEDREGR